MRSPFHRNQPAKRKARPDIVHSTQPNPNFVANGGFENKGVDTVKDNHDDSDPMIKNNIYSVQNGYQYNGAHTYPEQVPFMRYSNDLNYTIGLMLSCEKRHTQITHTL